LQRHALLKLDGAGHCDSRIAQNEFATEVETTRAALRQLLGYAARLTGEASVRSTCRKVNLSAVPIESPTIRSSLTDVVEREAIVVDHRTDGSSGERARHRSTGFAPGRAVRSEVQARIPFAAR
jgi:hypothetical protein